MPFQFPEPISDWFDRRNARAKIEKLIADISDLSKLSQDKDSALASLLQRHLSKAEEEYQHALLQYNGDIEECKRRTEFGIFRLELAKQQLSVAQEGKFIPDFEVGSAEHGALTLSAAIAHTKLAVEYSNCVVSESIRSNLIGVVTMFNDAVDMIRMHETAMSKRTSEGGLLMLYLLERQIELDNRQSIVDLKNIPRFSDKLSKKIKDSVDLICNLRETVIVSEKPISSRIMKHLDSAVDNFYAAVQAYVDDDVDIVERLTTTVRMQVQLADKLFKGGNLPMGAVSESEDDIDSLSMRVNEFKQKLLRLQRVITKRSPNAADANKHLDAALKYYLNATQAYREYNFEEAKRLSRAAHLDLDFVSQLLFSTQPAKYREL